jgi:hypothetical protein
MKPYAIKSIRTNHVALSELASDRRLPAPGLQWTRFYSPGPPLARPREAGTRDGIDDSENRLAPAASFLIQAFTEMTSWVIN